MEISGNAAKPGSAAAAKREHRKYVMAQASLRVLTCILTAIAAILMGSNKESSSVEGFQMDASMNSDHTFQFFVIGNAIGAGYAAFSLIFLYYLNKKCIMHVLDLLALCLVVATAASATAVGYLGKYGNNTIGWSSVCSYYEKFCQKTAISVALNYIGTFLLIPACAYRSSTTRAQESNMNPTSAGIL